MEIPLYIDGHYGNLCSTLSGFFLLMTVLTITFDIQATVLLIYKPNKQPDKISVNMKNVSVNEEEQEVKRHEDEKVEVRTDPEASDKRDKAETEMLNSLMQKDGKEKDSSEVKCHHEEVVMMMERTQDSISFPGE